MSNIVKLSLLKIYSKKIIRNNRCLDLIREQILTIEFSFYIAPAILNFVC